MKQLERERERERTECGSLIDLNSHTSIKFSLYILFIIYFISHVIFTNRQICF